jgi:hypothetical protein
MSQDKYPHILIIDDEETSQYELELGDRAATRARHPRDVDISDLEWADLVLMDFILSNWPERDDQEQISLRPANGLALAAVLREHADHVDNSGHRYTAFAIHSAHIGDISRRLHTTNRTPCVVARLNNLEWAFDKADATRFVRSAALAEAAQQVSTSWPQVETGGVRSACTDLLQISGDLPWSDRAADDVVLCQIPLLESSAGTNGLLFLRWLLHGILPYPTFLLARQWVAARLRITPDSLSRVVEGESALARELDGCRYTGVLREFDGLRWWRAGVDQFAWELRAAGAREPEEFHAELERRAGIELDRVPESSPAVCVNRELQPLDALCGLDSVVRLVPDLWPAYADPAYAAELVVREDADLRAIVHPLDRERVLSADEEA